MRCFGHVFELDFAAALTKARSKGAFWATKTVSSPPTKSIRDEITSEIGGELLTVSSSIPVNAVMYGGIGWPGLTNVEKVSKTAPPLIRIAPISVIPAPRCGALPLVSRSNTTNSTR